MGEIVEIVDQYINKFMDSDHTLIKIKDENYPNTFLKKRLQERIRARGVAKIIAYVFMDDLYLEKL